MLDGPKGASTFKCASSGGTCAWVRAACAGSNDFRRVFEEFLLATELFDFGSVAAAVVLGADFADFACCALMVELEEDVDDSRTGGRALRLASLVAALTTPEAGRRRSGLLVAYFASLPLEAKTPLEYDEAELGVGTWLYGESVYLDEGVAECESPGTGGVKSRIGYVFCVSNCGSAFTGAAELRYESRYSYLLVGGKMPSTASSNASL